VKVLTDHTDLIMFVTLDDIYRLLVVPRFIAFVTLTKLFIYFRVVIVAWKARCKV